MSGLRWYAVQTEMFRESEAAANVRRLGDVEMFYPRHWVEIRHARKVRSELRPLLTGFLFARMDVPSFAPVRRQMGVRDLLGLPGLGPQAVADWQMLKFRLLFDLDGVLIVPEPPSPEELADKYPPGTRAPIIDGPRSGIIAEVKRVDGPDKIRVLMQWFGGLVETQVPASFLGEPVSPDLRMPSKATA